MKKSNLINNNSASKKAPTKSLRVKSYVFVSCFTILIYLISNKTGYYFRKYEGVVKEHDPVDWLPAFQGTLSDLPVVLFTLILIISIAEFSIQKKQENAT